jgi:hypothetical protein
MTAFNLEASRQQRKSRYSFACWLASEAIFSKEPAQNVISIPETLNLSIKIQNATRRATMDPTKAGAA